MWTVETDQTLGKVQDATCESTYFHDQLWSAIIEAGK